MGRPNGSQSKGPRHRCTFDQCIIFGNYFLNLLNHPENVYAVYLCIDSNNIFGYSTGYLSKPLNTWTHFVNAVIPKVKFPGYDIVTIFGSYGLFLVT